MTRVDTMDWVNGYRSRPSGKRAFSLDSRDFRAYLIERLKKQLQSDPKFWYLAQDLTPKEFKAIMRAFGEALLDTIALRGAVHVPQLCDIRLKPRKSTPVVLSKRPCKVMLRPQVAFLKPFTFRVRKRARELGMTDPLETLQCTMAD